MPPNPIGFKALCGANLEADRYWEHSVLDVFDRVSAILQAEQFRFLGRELLFGQQPLGFQRA
jgi:hypothetical protein